MALKAEPHNIRKGLVEGALVVNQDYCAIAVGECFIVGEGVYIAVAGERLFSLGVARPAGAMTISAALYNENETVLAAIEDSEWVSGDPFPWDIESDHQQLSVRRKSADISLEIDARSNPVRVRATLWRQGHCFVLDAGGVRMGASPMAGRILNLGLAGLALDFDTAQGSAKIIPDPPLWRRCVRVGS